MMNRPPDFRSSMHRRPSQPGRIEKARDPRRSLARLALYLEPYMARIGVVIGFIIIYTLLGLAGPYLMGIAIDRFIGGGDKAGLVRIALTMLLAYALSNLFNIIANRLMARISQQALRRLRRDLFTHLQTQSMNFFDSNPAGSLMSRLTNDIDAINQAVSQNITSLVASILSMAGILITMFVLNAWLALGSLVVVPIMLWFTQFIARYTRKGFRELQKSLGGLNAIAEESISGQKVIKAFRRNETVIAAFREQNEAVFRAGVYANSYALLLMPLTNVLGNFFVIVLAGLGGWLALQNLVSVGMIATFINYG
jgi:ATP-binding cassette subfamily B protein